MKNGKQLFGEFNKFNGAKFISIRYTSKNGEVAIHVINTNISVMNAKQRDFQTLKTPSFAAKKQVLTSALNKGIDKKIVKLAWSELLVSAEKNLSENIEDRTISSQAQTDAYENIINGIRLHKETGHLHIFGQAISKKVLVEGEPQKESKSAPKTIAKKIITKALDLRAGKYRTFILPEVEQVKINHETIELM
jgi:hypothetical protein